VTAVEPDLFAGFPDAPRLVGSRCSDCGAATFPAQGSCPRCTSTSVGRHALAPTGTLWSWTVQGFPPKEPYLGAVAGGPFTPFGVGYVDLGGEVLVESRLIGAPGSFRIGQPMRLVLEPLPGDGGLVGFAFAADDTAGGTADDTVEGEQ